MAEEELIILIRIEEGVSLNAAETILLSATLSGNRMEAEPVRPGYSTIFDCNLIYETNRSSIKRMKSENLPVKLEVFALKDFKRSVEDATKEHIGYILIPVKNIPIVTLSKALQTKPRWMRLIGLSKEWRQHKPELLVNVLITSKDYLSCDKETTFADTQELEPSDSIVIEENPVPRMLSSQQGIFIRLLQDEGLLQVGNIDTDCDIFRVHILIKGIRNLESIVNGRADDLFFNYVVLGNEHMRALDKKFNRMHQIQEKISINFRSSLKSLREYFEKIFYIPFEINSGSMILGESEIRINNLIRTLNMTEFLKEQPNEQLETCQIKLPTQSTISTSTAQQQQQPAVLEFKTVIKYAETKKLLQTEFLEKYKKRQEHDDSKSGGGDGVGVGVGVGFGGDNKSEKNVKFDTQKQKQQKHQQIENIDLDTTKSHASDEKSILNEKVEISSNVNTDEKKSNDLPRVFCHTLQIDSIKFGKKPEKGIWQFILFNDRADIVKSFVNHEIIEVDNLEENTVNFDKEKVQLKLYFTSTVSQIYELIQSSECCTLTVKGPRSYQVKAQLECKSLCTNDNENISGIILMQSASEDLNAIVRISVKLQTLGINFNSQFKCENLTTAEMQIEDESKKFEDRKALMLDEDLTYKMIEELESWKESQKQTFLDELKCKEKKFLDQLRDSWMKKQEKLESELHEKAEKLACMTKRLEEAKNIISDKAAGYTEEDIDKVRKKISEYYQNEIQNLKETSFRTEADLRHDIRMMEIKADEIARANRILELENSDMKENSFKLQQQLKEQIGNSVPKHEAEKLVQDIRLLNEKCEATNESKKYYKEQWAKAFRECHQLRQKLNQNTARNAFQFDCNQVCECLSNDDCQIDEDELEELKNCLNSED